MDASRVIASTTEEGLVLDAEFPPNALAAGKHDVPVVTKEGNKVIATGGLTLE